MLAIDCPIKADNRSTDRSPYEICSISSMRRGCPIVLDSQEEVELDG